jgi:hypothetical protein
MCEGRPESLCLGRRAIWEQALVGSEGRKPARQPPAPPESTSQVNPGRTAYNSKKCAYEGLKAHTATEKEEMLRRESFPQNDDDQYYELPPAGSAHKRVTESEPCTRKQSIKKAPGPDKLTFGAIRMLWNVEPTLGEAIDYLGLR